MLRVDRVYVAAVRQFHGDPFGYARAETVHARGARNVADGHCRGTTEHRPSWRLVDGNDPGSLPQHSVHTESLITVRRVRGRRLGCDAADDCAARLACPNGQQPPMALER